MSVTEADSMGASAVETMDTDLAIPDTVNDEYAVQYFGFLPQSFMNGMYNCMSENLKDAMSALNEGILNSFPESVVEAELQEMSYRLGKSAVERLEAKFDKAEMFLLNNVFNIPMELVLPGDRLQVEQPCSLTEMEQLDKEIQDLVNKIMQVKFANAVLQDKIEEMDSLQGDLDSNLTKLETVHTIAGSLYRERVREASVLDKLKEIVTEGD